MRVYKNLSKLNHFYKQWTPHSTLFNYIVSQIFIVVGAFILGSWNKLRTLTFLTLSTYALVEESLKVKNRLRSHEFSHNPTT